MRTSTMQRNVADFGMDTISLAGPLEAKLAAVKAAGFGQVMMAARDIVGHPQGIEAAIAAVRSSGLRVTGFQVLRDFEGLSGHLHSYKVDIAKQMILMARDLGAPVLLACSSTSSHATADADAIARDLRKLALLALPHGIRVAFEGLSWGRHINEVHQAWAAVEHADCPNLGLAIDSYHQFATSTPLTALADVDPAKIYLVQLSDFMWQETRTVQERIDTARHFRVFPGEGVHSQRWPNWCAHSTAWVIRAITALKSSTTTTNNCPCRLWPNAHGKAPCGWPRECCNVRFRCPGTRVCGPRCPPDGAVTAVLRQPASGRAARHAQPDVHTHAHWLARALSQRISAPTTGSFSYSSSAASQ